MSFATNRLPATIMVVDDNPANLRLLATLLTSQGYGVRPARNGQMAYRSAQAEPPDLILLDIRMPDLDGYKVCTRLKASPTTAEVPVIFVSALDDVFDKVKAFEVGAVDYLTKPFQSAEVLARVRTHLALRALRQQQAEQNQSLRTALEQLQTLQQQLVEKEALEASHRARNEFLSLMSHELRTPLTVILMRAELLWKGRQGELNERQRGTVDQIQKSANRLHELINDMFELIALGSHRRTLHVQTVQINFFCEQLLQAMQLKANEKAIQLRFSPAVNGLSMITDEQHLLRILQKLLDNAIKFTPDGGQVGLAIDYACEAQVNFAVWDTGIGIAPENLPRLFQPFTQLNSGLARPFQGAGIGLALAARTSELLGGKIAVESTVGQGSRFTVTLPQHLESASP
jgi:two-component system, sensor histidine kinase and response regulator